MSTDPATWPAALAASRATDEFVLFLDFWGGAARSQHQDELLKGQSHFLGSLFATQAAYPSVEVQRAGDVAYAYDLDLKTLIHFAFTLFKKMTLDEGRLLVRPLRAGISQGTVHVETQAARLRLGPGNVEAARLEKSALKGMRLFVSKEIGEKLLAQGSPSQVRTSNARGIEHGELNWLQADPVFSDYLGMEIEGRPLREVMREQARTWIEAHDNYTQQLGASLNELLKWDAKG